MLRAMMKNIWKGHIKSEYVMSFLYGSDYTERNRNGLEYQALNEKNKSDFCGQDFIHPSLVGQGRQIGAYKNGNPIGFINVVLKGEKGGFFQVRKSDISLQKVYVFPEYRGKEVALDMLSHCVYQFGGGGVSRQSVCGQIMHRQSDVTRNLDFKLKGKFGL